MREEVIKIRENLALACDKSGRESAEITIVAATKTVSYERLNGLKDCGVFICGENRVQELLDKYGKIDVIWHFIGRLQTNKVKYIIDKVALIQSLDRIELAEEIQKQAKKRGTIVDCLVEINAGEENKGGIPLTQLYDFLNDLKKFDFIRVLGLMTVPPLRENPEENRDYYLQIFKIYDKLKGEPNCYRGQMRYLSMGMSADYALAVECGSNMIRPGRAIFGERR